MTGSFPTAEVDHRDLDKANDAWGNLREATSSQQKCNVAVRVDNALAMKGVCATVSGFFAHITIEGQRKYLGHFATAAEAQAARAAAEIEMHGEFRRAA
jgi:HNH endonuclease